MQPASPPLPQLGAHAVPRPVQAVRPAEGATATLAEPAFTLRHLVVLVAVGETGSISRAAGRLHLTPSAVSTSITELERRMGVPLTIRQRAKGVGLTPTGEEVIRRARELLHDAHTLQQDMRGSDEVVGPVGVGCFPSLGPTLLPPLIQRFNRLHPRAKVDFYEAPQDALRRLVDSGELDVAVVYGLDLPPEWKLTRLHSRPPLVVLPGDHPLALETDETEGIDLCRLSDEPMVLLDIPPSSNHAHAICSQAGFAPRVAYRTGNYETMRAFVGCGLGWSILVQRPYSDITYGGQSLALRKIVTPAVRPVDIGIANSRTRPMSRAARALIDLAKKSGDAP